MKIKTIIWAILIFGIPQSQAANCQNKIPFQESYDECLRNAKKLDKPILLYFVASWCDTCSKQLKENERNERFNTSLQSTFLSYKVDISTPDGLSIAERYDVSTFPAMVLTDKNARKIETFTGFYNTRFLKNKLNKINEKYHLFSPMAL